MRQMPHGRWVAFENNEPHECSRPPRVKPIRSVPRKPTSIPPNFPILSFPTKRFRRRLQHHRHQLTNQRRPPGRRSHRLLRPRVLRRLPATGSTTRENATDRKTIAAPPAAPTPKPLPVGNRSGGPISGSLRAIFTVYVMIGIFHSIAFSLFVGRVTCAATTKALISIFCNAGMGITHLAAVRGWPCTFGDLHLKFGKARVQRRKRMRPRQGFAAHSHVSWEARPNAGMGGWGGRYQTGKFRLDF
jgi:hypothetical protein